MITRYRLIWLTLYLEEFKNIRQTLKLLLLRYFQDTNSISILAKTGDAVVGAMVGGAMVTEVGLTVLGALVVGAIVVGTLVEISHLP